MSDSHTSTSEWQRFEARMRRRRVEGCVRRATAAIEAHRPDEATRVLKEARALDPEHPDIEPLAGRLRSFPTSLDGPLLRWMPVAVALTLLSLFAASGW